jgi:hypothetical protein
MRVTAVAGLSPDNMMITLNMITLNEMFGENISFWQGEAQRPVLGYEDAAVLCREVVVGDTGKRPSAVHARDRVGALQLMLKIGIRETARRAWAAESAVLRVSSHARAALTHHTFCIVLEIRHNRRICTFCLRLSRQGQSSITLSDCSTGARQWASFDLP